VAVVGDDAENRNSAEPLQFRDVLWQP
jgi:hypothetical protein